MIEYTIICDGCGRLMSAHSFSAAKARDVAKEAFNARTRGRKDYCGVCYATGEHQPREVQP